jgi:hypothetical protein
MGILIMQGLGELAEEWNIPVIGPHKEDQFWLDMIQEVSARYGFQFHNLSKLISG